MDIKIININETESDRIEIYCKAVNDEIKDIIGFIKSRQGQITGTIENTRYEIPVADIFYIEGVDSRVFVYCDEKVYEARQKLYEFEEILREKHFLRVSKSVLLNLMKVESIKPALNGRFTASLYSGEKIIISRKYVPELKKALKGGE